MEQQDDMTEFESLTCFHRSMSLVFYLPDGYHGSLVYAFFRLDLWVKILWACSGEHCDVSYAEYPSVEAELAGG